jgi:SpoIID/LytB domain protein
MLVVRAGDGGLDLSAKVRLNNYILGISEMPYAWGNTGGMAALRAQAIAARSYARELMIHRGNPANNLCDAWCHVRDTTWDQRYVGTGHGQANWVNATRQTAGKVMTHSAAPNQDIVRGYYSSSSGGNTENIEEVWPWWDPQPYYESADDHWAVDGTVSNPNASWTVTLSNEEVADAVGLPEITRIWVSKRNTSGSANTVSFTDGDTTVTETSAWMRTTFLLKSIDFRFTMG